MNNFEDDDFTPEEKALLKREARYRIEQQRLRESSSPMRAAIVFAVIAVLAKVAATRVQPVALDIVGNVFLMVTVILLVITLLKRK